jgi:cell division protein FtsL
MLRWLTTLTALATIVAAFCLTWIKHDTRRLEAKVQTQERQIEKAENDIAVLRAELGFLTRPERLDPLARTLLGLQPATSAQIIAVDQIPRKAVDKAHSLVPTIRSARPWNVP